MLDLLDPTCAGLYYYSQVFAALPVCLLTWMSDLLWPVEWEKECYGSSKTETFKDYGVV